MALRSVKRIGEFPNQNNQDNARAIPPQTMKQPRILSASIAAAIAAPSKRQGGASALRFSKLIALSLGFAAPLSTHAATLTWDVNGLTNNWSTAAGNENWFPGSVVWNQGDDAVFGATADGTISVTTAVTVNDILFGSSQTIGSGGAGSFTLADANSDITVTNSSDTATIAETFAGAGSITKLGAGTLALTTTVANTFAGGLNINAGVLSFVNNLALGGVGGAAGAVSLNGGTLRVNAPAGTVTNTHDITIGASGGTINSQNGTGTYIMGADNLFGSGALTISGTGSLVTTGAGVVVFNGANTYNGVVTIQDGGIVEYANAGGVATGGSFVVGNQGSLSATGVTIARDVTVNAGGILSFQNGNTGVFSGNITLNGATTIGLRDWYNYNTVRSGTITGTITGAQTITVNSGTTLGTGGTLTLGGFDAKASSADIILNSASLAMNSGSGTAVPSVTRANSLTINTGNLNVTGVASQNTNDVFGTLNLGGGSAGNLQGFSTWTISPNAATGTALTFTNMGTRTAGSWVALSGTIGSASPGTAGAGNIFFTNAPSGSNLIGAGGTLASGTASVIPWMRDQGGNNIYGYDATVGVAPVTTVATANLDTATADQNVNLTGANGSTHTLTGSKTINSLKAGFINVNMGGNTLTVASGVITSDNSTLSNGTLDFGTVEGQLSVHQARQLNLDLPITGSGGLTFVGFRTNSGNAGRLRLGGANTYTGVTNFYGYGAATADFYITNSLALQNTTVNYVAGRGSTLFFGNGGTSGQTAYTFGGLTGNANINLNNNNTTAGVVALTLGSAGSADTASTVNTYSGVLSNTVAGGSIIKDGVATQVLSGANTYTGPTNVIGGTLEISGSIGGSSSTAISVSAGTLLLSGAGTNRVTDTSSVALGGGTLAFASTVGGGLSETVGELTLSATSSIDFGTGANGNQFTFASAPAFGAGFTLNIFNWSGSTYSLGQTDPGTGATQDRLLFNTDPAFDAAQISFYSGPDINSTFLGTGNEISFGVSQFEIVPVPEPSSTALVGSIVLLGLIGYRERLRRVRAVIRRHRL